MKRTPFKRKPTSSFKARRKRLRVVGHSDTAEVKRNIQDLVRAIVIARDGGCIFRNLYDYLHGQPPCGGYAKDGHLILQADHLLSRSNSATYADTRLIVCVCKGHHGWKSVGNNLRKAQYDALVKTLLPPDRVKLWEACEADSWRAHRTGIYDWKMAEIALTAELTKLTAKELL
jgi:hypothetical protein